MNPHKSRKQFKINTLSIYVCVSGKLRKGIKKLIKIIEKQQSGRQLIKPTVELHVFYI